MVQALGTPPAKVARRLRVTRIFLGFSIAVVLLGVVPLGLDHFGLLKSKFNQILFVVVVVCVWGGFMIWNALTFRVACPRCQWNIYFKKNGFMAMMLFTPSTCPNCGLDLEQSYHPRA
jgi:hypothetical protein